MFQVHFYIPYIAIKLWNGGQKLGEMIINIQYGKKSMLCVSVAESMMNGKSAIVRLQKYNSRLLMFHATIKYMQ